MNCYYHQVTLANTRCHTCGRPLCPACDHRVKAFTYCQDCIVAGVESLSRAGVSVPMAGAKSPFLAALLGFIPGLGSVYNGLVVRALVHFAVIVGLWQIEDIFNARLFWWAGVLFYGYSILDAFQTAKRINAGHDLGTEEEKLKGFMRDKTRIWGAGLIGIGVLTILHWIWPSVFEGNLWPLMLIGAGGYLLYWFRDRVKTAKRFTGELPPQITTTPNFDPLARDYTHAETRRFDVR